MCASAWASCSTASQRTFPTSARTTTTWRSSRRSVRLPSHAAFNLVHKIDVEQTQARLAHYEALNKSLINAQQQQREQESLRQQQLDEAEREEKQRRARQVKDMQEREQQEREQEEKEIVAELEKGRNIDDVMEELRQRREARARTARKQEQEEWQRQRRFEQQLHAAPVSSAPTALSVAGAAYARRVATSDFAGPMALIDDGSQLVETRAAPVSLGGLGGGSGYYDPWLKAEQVAPALVAQYRAGGYDWQHQVWQRGVSSACDGLALQPLP